MCLCALCPSVGVIFDIILSMSLTQHLRIESLNRIANSVSITKVHYQDDTLVALLIQVAHIWSYKMLHELFCRSVNNITLGTPCVHELCIGGSSRLENRRKFYMFTNVPVGVHLSVGYFLRATNRN